MTPLDAEDAKNTTLADLYAKRQEASASRLQWEKYESSLSKQILALLGYVDNGEKPTPREVKLNGVPVFRVDIVPRLGLDQKRLKERHPAAYADCERTTYVKSIKSA